MTATTTSRPADAAPADAPAAARAISPAEFAARQGQGSALHLIDVRTWPEFAEVHARGARCVPLDELSAAAIAPATADQPVYLICKSGARAARARERLAAAGFSQAVCVEGGTLAWEQAGLPVVRGPKTISLERQVRIAAGSLVLIGVILGTWVNSWLYVLCGLVGAGLVFAGITDTCGMGMLLARAPWNRRRPPQC